MFSLDGKVALVTGGGRGIGRALAQGLAEAGADLVIAGRTQETLDQAAAEIGATGRQVLALLADIGRIDDIEAMVEAAIERFGRIDVLVNNAAAGAGLTAAEQVAPEDYDAQMNVNLRGTFFVTTAVARRMIEAGGGSIVNISSIVGQVAGPRAAVYSAAKGALDALTRTLAVEWARFGIRVNSLAPGYVETDLTGAVLDRKKIDEYIAARTPMGRMAKTNELIGAVVYLASDAAGYHTGQVLTVDGGWTAW